MKNDTDKRNKSLFSSLFKSHSKPIKHDQKKISLSLLKKQAITREKKDIFQRIEHEKIPSVRNAWIDYFLEKIKESKSR